MLILFPSARRHTRSLPLHFGTRCCDFDVLAVLGVTKSKKGNNLPNKCFIVTYLPKYWRKTETKHEYRKQWAQSSVCAFFSIVRFLEWALSLLLVLLLGRSGMMTMNHIVFEYIKVNLNCFASILLYTHKTCSIAPPHFFSFAAAPILFLFIDCAVWKGSPWGFSSSFDTITILVAAVQRTFVTIPNAECYSINFFGEFAAENTYDMEWLAIQIKKKVRMKKESFFCFLFTGNRKNE